MKIKKNWFDAEHIYSRDEEGHEYSLSLLWYPKLRTATDEETATDLSEDGLLINYKRLYILRHQVTSAPTNY